MKNKYAKMSITILILILIDQITKFIVIKKNEVTLKNEFIANFGGAFGIGGDSTIFFILVNFVILGIIIKFIVAQKDRVDRKTLSSYTLILAGGFSNLIDRLFRGFVVDYIDLSKFVDFPVFNIADIYIVVGWTMLFVSILIYWGKEVRRVNCKKEENP